MERITVERIKIGPSRIEVFYDISDGLLQYFDRKQNVFWIEYTENISIVPTSIAVVPFVCNVLPIIWLTNSSLVLPELDKTFYKSIEEFERGYIEMYPMLSFKGQLEIKNIVDNSYLPDGGNAAFFSGGVDAFTTLICHRSEHPTLITLRGADVKLDDTEGWANVYNHLQNTVKQFNLPKPICVTSNFRTFIDEGRLSQLVVKSNDGWWHGFQHGIGILSQAAPIAYIRHLAIIYIASSNTKEEITTCASDPTIDNYIRYGKTIVVHDQYEKNRQKKIETIVDYCKETNQTIDTRVCWISRGGKNCCHCEKCLRTMYAFMAEGESPKKFGFNYKNDDLSNSQSIIREALYNTNDTVRGNWKYTINRFNETGAYKDDPRINWVYTLDPYASKPKPGVILRLKIKIAKWISIFGIKV